MRPGDHVVPGAPHALVLGAVDGVEAALRGATAAALQRHADLVLHDAERALPTPADVADVRQRHAALTHMRRTGAPVAGAAAAD